MNFSEIKQQLSDASRNWLVTGGAGFIGSHIAQRLLSLGQTVFVIDNLSTGKESNITLLEETAKSFERAEFLFVEGDVQNPSLCTEYASKVDHILHQAALGSVPRSLKDPLMTHESNLTGFLHLLLAAKESNVKSFVYASSSSVYGDDPSLPKIESSLGRVLSPYAASKRANELYADSLTSSCDFPITGLRYFNVFGPRQDPEGPYAAVIPRWIACLQDGRPLTIYGDGETSRDFCYIENVVQANLLAALSPFECGSMQINIAAGKQTTLSELATLLQDAFLLSGTTSGAQEILFEDFRAGDVKHSLADLTLASEFIGYEPVVDVAEGIALTVGSAEQA